MHLILALSRNGPRIPRQPQPARELQLPPVRAQQQSAEDHLLTGTPHAIQLISDEAQYILLSCYPRGGDVIVYESHMNRQIRYVQGVGEWHDSDATDTAEALFWSFCEGWRDRT